MDETFAAARSLESIIITLDFLKSSSRGGPRVPRPLLLVKVTVAAAPRAAPLASRPKFTRYSFLHSRLLKKVTRTPLFGPPFFRLSASTWTRDNSFIARPLTPPARGIPCAPCLLRPPSTSPAGSQLPRVSTCTHGTVLSGSALFALKVRVLYHPLRFLGTSGNPIWNYAGSRTRISWKVISIGEVSFS